MVRSTHFDPDFVAYEPSTVRDVSDIYGMEICTVSVGEGATEVSINPLNWKQIFLSGPAKITLWTLEQCGNENLLTPV